MHPRISPGESGFERGIVASYLPVQSFGRETARSSPTLPESSRRPPPVEPGSSAVRSSFNRASAATNWIVDTSARRVGSEDDDVAFGEVSLSAEASADVSACEPSIRRCCPGPMGLPAGIWLASSSESRRASWKRCLSEGKFIRIVCTRCAESIAISTNTYRVLIVVSVIGTMAQLGHTLA